MSRRLMGMRHHLDDDIIDGESETRLHVGIMYILSLPLTELFLFDPNSYYTADFGFCG
jgi:hypothetical protein